MSTTVNPSVVERMRRIDRNVGLINHYASFKMPDGRQRIQFGDLVEQVKADATFVESELKNMQELWKKVKPAAKGIL